MDNLRRMPAIDAARPAVGERLRQVGVRLAHLIDAAAAGTLPTDLRALSEP
jgi:hypothetical protein